MRREYIPHSSDKPVIISFATINYYPIHWHESIEILYVLKGKLHISIDSDEYDLTENDIEIINLDESHTIKGEKDNKVLIFHIDPYFFEKYYSDIKNMVFFTNTTDDNAQKGEEYDELRTFLSKLVCESYEKQDNFKEEIENILINLLYHMINNFHYLMYDNEDLKENGYQIQRYHRIIKYIFNNYDNNITLQDIAKKEYLSTQYISHEIKDAIGYSFTDLVNLTRVEEAAKLLLDTDKTISEICLEIGFSHSRYLNKHFKIHYKCTPLQYRKKYKVSEEVFNESKNVSYYKLESSIAYILYYLEDYDRFNYKDKVTEINIDMNKELGNFNKSFKDIINLGNAFSLLLEDNKIILKGVQEDIGFTYGRIFNLFSRDMCIFPGSKFYNWNRVKDVFEFLSLINLKPLIVLEQNEIKGEDFLDIMVSFLEYFKETLNFDFTLLKFEFTKNIEPDIKSSLINLFLKYEIDNCHKLLNFKDTIDSIYDTPYMLPFIINNVINIKKGLPHLHAYDELYSHVNLTNEVFFGYPGLINYEGIKKPSYYAYYLLSKLGDTIVAEGKGYIVTKKLNEYEILLYNYHNNLNKLISFESLCKMKGAKLAASKKLSINIFNLTRPIRITSYEINERSGSSYNYWVNMGKPSRLSKEEKQILLKASFPSINFKSFKKSTIYNFQTRLKGFGAVLFIIKET